MMLSFEEFLNENNDSTWYKNGNFQPIEIVIKDYISSIEDNYGASGDETEEEQDEMRRVLSNLLAMYKNYEAFEVSDDDQRAKLFELLRIQGFQQTYGKGSETVKIQMLDQSGDFVIAVHGDENFFILRNKKIAKHFST
jgi:hypothetical protein